MFYNITLCRYRVRYFSNLSNIDDRVRNISWQTLNLTQTLTLTLPNPNPNTDPNTNPNPNPKP